MSIDVLGYYFKNNIGDDAYPIVFPQIFKTDMVFSDRLPKDAKDVILGGGAVLNKHFLELMKNKNCRKRAFSVSIGDKLGDFSILKDFESIHVRDQTSLEYLYEQGITAKYCPDAAFILQKGNKERGLDLLTRLFHGKELYAKRIGIVFNSFLTVKNGLSRDWVNLHSVLSKLGQLCDSTNASFVFLPFGTKEPFDDRISNGWLASYCKYYQKNCVLMGPCSVQSMLDIMSVCDVMISTRLHGTIFSVINHIPFIDITHHDKNYGFLNSINKREWSVPYYDFNLQSCKSLVEDFLQDPKKHQESLQSIDCKQKDSLNVCFSE